MRGFWAVFMAVWATLALAFPDPPSDLTATAVYVADAETGQVVLAKAPGEARYPASTTKIVTGLLLAEAGDLDRMVVVGREVVGVTGSRLRLRPGERISRRDLLKAILLYSANDACMTAAVDVAGSVPAFVERMNQRAAQLGATLTSFKNPNGLHDAYHYTTAQDLARIAVAAMKNPVFRQTVGLKSFTPSISGRPEQELPNRNKLIGVDPTNLGIKTGWTNPAGRCFVGWHEQGGMTLVTVVLGCPKDWVPDQTALVAWVWDNFERRELKRPGERVGSAPVAGALNGPAGLEVVGVKEARIVPRQEPTLVRSADFRAPVARGTAAGMLVYRAAPADGSDWTWDAVSQQVVTSQRVWSRWVLLWAALGLAGLATVILLFSGRRNRGRPPRGGPPGAGRRSPLRPPANPLVGSARRRPPASDSGSEDRS